MITINRKDTYDIKLSKRRVQLTGRGAARSGPEAGGGEQSTGREDLSSGSGEQVERCGAHGAEDSQQADAGHDREARHQDPGPGNPGGRAPRIYPGLQARAGEAGGRQRAQQRHHPRAERSHRRPQVPAGDANQLRSRRRITNRALRGPSSGYRIKLQATSLKLQAASVLPKHQAPSSKRQAPSRKQQAPGSRCLHKV